MNVRLPKSWEQLPQHQKDLINEAKTEEVEKEVNKNMAKLQKLWLQFACIVLHKNFGFDAEQAMLFLANWRQMYRINNGLKNEAEQTAYLAAEMNKIFGEGGYPYQYIDKLEDMK